MAMAKVTKKEYERRYNLFQKDLRSGNFRQTKGVLTRVSKKDPLQVIGNCCLGVGCVTYEKDTGDSLKYRIGELATQQHDNAIMVRKYGNDNTGVLPARVMKYFGFKDAAGSFEAKNGDGGSDLTELNDVRRWGFTRIANFIERHKKELFTWA